jgi:hypothetical protein
MTLKTRDVKIPEDLCLAAESKFTAQFGGLEPWLVHVLKELLKDDATALDRDEQQMLESRLKDLGYM